MTTLWQQHCFVWILKDLIHSSLLLADAIFYLLRSLITSTDHNEGDNKKYGDDIIFAGILFHNKALKTAYAVFVTTNKRVRFSVFKAEYFYEVSGPLHVQFVYGLGFLNITSRFLDKPVYNAAGSRKSLLKGSELSCALLC